MATKKKSSHNKQSNSHAQQKSKKQLRAIIWFALSVFLLFVVFIEGENIWNVLHNFMFRLFGVTAYAYPFLLGAIAIVYAKDKEGSTANAKIIESIILVVLFGAFINVCGTDASETFNDNISNAWGIDAKYDGGLLGSLIGFPILLAFGKAGAIITLILLLFVFIMIITGTHLMSFIKAVTKPAKAVSEQASNAFATSLTVT